MNTPTAAHSDQNITTTTDPNVQSGAEVHDLRRLFRSIGSFSGERGATSVQPRSQCDIPVEMLENAPVRVTGSPLDVAGFVDGIQSSLVLTHRDHRPVHLNYTAAAAVDVSLRPLGVQERLEIVVGERDLEWARGLDCTIPLTVVADADPAETQRLAVQGLGGSREQLERALVGQLLAQPRSLVLDGSLVARPVDVRLVGVVKTTNRRYLPDESLLYGMQSGWRSPAFRIPAGSQAYPSDRFSCYVRLFDASSRAWDFGLVRIEALDPDILQPLSALCLQQRQGARNNDPRGDRHLRPVRACEDLLRARRPAVFSL